MSRKKANQIKLYSKVSTEADKYKLIFPLFIFIYVKVVHLKNDGDKQVVEEAQSLMFLS